MRAWCTGRLQRYQVLQSFLSLADFVQLPEQLL